VEFRFRVPHGAAIVSADEFLRSVKPAAAFSIGLSTGAAAIAVVGLVYVQSAERARTNTLSAADSKPAEKTEQIRLLEQENARLNAEVQRFKETAAMLKNSLAAQTANTASYGSMPPPPPATDFEEVVVSEPPPPPIVEEVYYPAPSPSHVWIGGSWTWYGGRWVWVRGRWAWPPHRRAIWVGGHWKRRGGSGVWITGHWR
jgi:hypothetical protein